MVYKPSTKTWSHKCNVRFKYAHWKRDGHFTTVIKSETGDLSLWTAKPIQLFGLEFLPEYPALQRLPPWAIVLGELWVPGKRSEYIKTAIIERDSRLRFECFAIERWGSFESIADFGLETIAAKCAEIALPFVPFHNLPSVQFPTVNAMLTEPLPPDCEGYVLKTANLKDWHKLKECRTIECVVQGFKPGEGKFAGQVGALICNVVADHGWQGKPLEYEVAACSGMTDVQRQWISANRLELIGKVVEVEYQCVGAQGRLRHPRFIRLREDKTAAECTVNQDEELALRWNSKEEQPTLFE